MNQNMVEMDPLSSYEYPAYDSYNPMIAPPPPPMVPVYNYDVKIEHPPIMNHEFFNHFLHNVTENNVNQDKVLTNLNEAPNTNNDAQNCNNDNDVKPVIKKEKQRGKRSSYWSEKITDNSFKFYGCAICNVSYPSLAELDQHVTIHKDRLTSYDLKLKNLMKRKKLKKEQKKLKKLKGKLKKEEKPDFDIPEIKPEDGYIGNEKAAEYNGDSSNQNNENQPSNSTDDKKDVKPNTSDNGKNDNVIDKNLEKIYKCFACLKQFTLSYYLKLHVRSHTDEKPYTCSICGQSFITASKLGRHNKRIHLAVRYQCRICYRFFSRFENLTVHFDKKHAEDKLEGEPYDFNAILPYLKELEEQLREKAESEAKPKTEDIWGDMWDPNQVQDSSMNIVPKDEDNKDFENPPPSTLNILIEEVKVDPPDVDIKREREDEDVPEDFDTSHPADDADNDSVKGERHSDDDYFPSNTWAASPKIEDVPLSPTRIKRSKGDGPLKCEVCSKAISTVSYMRVHMRTHTGERPFKCYVCGRGFITSSKMHRHVLTHQETWEGGSLIKKAKAKFNKKQAPGEKQKKYKKRPHACEFCHKRFLHLETLQVHKKSHDGENLVMKCNFCLETMVDEPSLREHEATHTGPKPFLCTICGKSYKKRETMVYHRKHHKPDKDYICNVCSKSFNAPCKLQRHIVSHRADKFVLRYECPVCAHMFNTKYHIQMHLATHQKEGLIVEENRNEILAMVLQNARKIPKQTDGSANLTDLIPSDERSRVCNICGEVFQHFYYLEEHLKSHGSRIALEDITKPEEKKHVCQVCNKSFKLHYYLKLHSFTHTKEKPFICQQCGKGFITKGKLKRHLETHTGLKKYQCHICYKFFTRPSYLRIHVRTIHGNQDYNFRLDKEYSVGSMNSMSMMSQPSI
ncbi:hypothetical protein ABMA28_012832 [Loxostege sticticalis]|uniref:C2H2-type domain-containing protein n=1 Tax=Loxostege sticticalis TaxID=481309 RepID=A0ABD0S3T5_LOXSC